MNAKLWIIPLALLTGVAYAQLIEISPIIIDEVPTLIQTKDVTTEYTKNTKIDGDFNVTKGTVKNREELRVVGNFHLGKDAKFENKGTLIIDSSKGRLETTIIPAVYRDTYTGAILKCEDCREWLSETGAVLGTIEHKLISATGSYMRRVVDLNVEKKKRTIVIPARYGPAYTETGMVLYATGALITATGSRTEIYTPSLGSVLIK